MNHHMLGVTQTHKVMSAKFAGYCGYCGNKFAAGDAICYDFTLKCAFCVGCPRVISTKQQAAIDARRRAAEKKKFERERENSFPTSSPQSFSNKHVKLNYIPKFYAGYYQMEHCVLYLEGNSTVAFSSRVMLVEGDMHYVLGVYVETNELVLYPKTNYSGTIDIEEFKNDAEQLFAHNQFEQAALRYVYETHRCFMCNNIIVNFSTLKLQAGWQGNCGSCFKFLCGKQDIFNHHKTFRF